METNLSAREIRANTEGNENLGLHLISNENKSSEDKMCGFLCKNKSEDTKDKRYKVPKYE